MRTSQAGIDLIKRFEGFSSVPYLCPAGYWTIGYGRTKGVNKHTSSISKYDAEDMLLDDLVGFENAVKRLISVPLTQGQFDALVSFTYNLGAGNLQISTLRMRLNRGDYDVTGEFRRWVYAKGRKLPGLIARREAETKLFEE